MRKSIILIAVVLLSLGFAPQVDDENLIQIALLLDTSNSMDGLINQAKAQLWNIVNEFALARKYGKVPKLQIALYEYGNNNLPKSDGYIRKVVDLTDNLDEISEELFNLTTNGGEEFCGAVIDRAVRELSWSQRTDILKIIFIAGNEPFTQGSVNYKNACKLAISKGIIVNTIYCGNFNDGIRTSWKDGADLADGMYSNIDQDQQLTFIEAPQDKELSRLGQELNETYIPYGERGDKAKSTQKAQDVKAEALSLAVMAERSVSKASANYVNVDWDLVDAMSKDSTVVEKIDKEQLPEKMQNMSIDEQKMLIRQNMEKRKQIQEKINKLNEERRKYIEEQGKKNANDKLLNSAIIKSVRKQAQSKNYTFIK